MNRFLGVKNATRPVNFCLAVAVLICGGSARKYGAHLPAFLASYAPDALWAAMVFFLLATLWPQWRINGTALAALVFACTIEVSQLYQAPWINALRETKLGALVLGRGFLGSDLICYAAGIACGVLLEMNIQNLTLRYKQES